MAREISPTLLVAQAASAGSARRGDSHAIRTLPVRDGPEAATLVVLANAAGFGQALNIHVAQMVVAELTAVSDIINLSEAPALLREMFAAGYRSLHPYISKASDGHYDRSCSCIVAILAAGRLYVGHIGICRLYLARANRCWPLTADHAVWDDVAGRRVVIRSLTDGRLSEPDLRLRFPPDDAKQQQGLSMLPGDQILLATPYFYMPLRNEEIGAHLRKTADPQTAVDRLLRLARLYWGDYHDKTAILLKQVDCQE